MTSIYVNTTTIRGDKYYKLSLDNYWAGEVVAEIPGDYPWHMLSLVKYRPPEDYPILSRFEGFYIIKTDDVINYSHEVIL